MTRALDILLQHAEQARDQALAACQQAQARLQGLQRQLDQLLGYQRDTEARDPTREGRSTGIDALLVHRSFMQRLQQAVDLQQGQLDHAQLHARAVQGYLLAAELRVAQVQKLQQRRNLENLRQQERQEQRRSDDAGQQRLHHSRAQAAEADAATSAAAASASPSTNRPDPATAAAKVAPPSAAPARGALMSR